MTSGELRLRNVDKFMRFARIRNQIGQLRDMQEYSDNQSAIADVRLSLKFLLKYRHAKDVYVD